MPWEYVGSLNSGEMLPDRWVPHTYDLASAYLNFVLKEKIPEGCSIDVMWREHELGDIPAIGVFWEFPIPEAPAYFIGLCETVLSNFNDYVEWDRICPDSVEGVVENYESENEDNDSLVDSDEVDFFFSWLHSV